MPSTSGLASISRSIACKPAPSSHGDGTSETEAEGIFSPRYTTENDSPPSSDEALPSSPTDAEDGRSPALELTLATPIAELASVVVPRSQFLLVDDNHINLKLLSAYMKKMGLKYQLATNGKEALDTFVECPQDYACILMDISMPVMDGFEATRQIRAHESRQGLGAVCIIALSGLASEDAHKEAFGSGMDLFLTKPVKLKSLGSLLESRGLMTRE
jgi:CheY-like chemotaxis protein